MSGENGRECGGCGRDLVLGSRFCDGCSLPVRVGSASSIPRRPTTGRSAAREERHSATNRIASRLKAVSILLLFMGGVQLLQFIVFLVFIEARFLSDLPRYGAQAVLIRNQTHLSQWATALSGLFFLGLGVALITRCTKSLTVVLMAALAFCTTLLLQLVLMPGLWYVGLLSNIVCVALLAFGLHAALLQLVKEREAASTAGDGQRELTADVPTPSRRLQGALSAKRYPDAFAVFVECCTTGAALDGKLVLALATSLWDAGDAERAVACARAIVSTARQDLLPDAVLILAAEAVSRQDFAVATGHLARLQGLPLNQRQRAGSQCIAASLPNATHE